jgi:hypothetical protein
MELIIGFIGGIVWVMAILAANVENEEVTDGSVR